MKRLTVNEQMLLLTIWRLKDAAYGVNIRNEVKKYTETDVGFGTLYNNLEQLKKKNYVISFKGEPTAARGGKRKVYYKITDTGLEALQSAKELQEKLWDGISGVALFRKN